MPRRSCLTAVLILASLLPAAAWAAPSRELLRFAPGRVWASSGVATSVDERAVTVDFSALLDRRLLLPLLDGRVYRLEAATLDLRGAGDYAWRGGVFDRDGEPVGTATLTVKGREMRGLISIPGAAYRIVPTADGSHRLVEVDDRRLAPCGADGASSIGELIETGAAPIQPIQIPRASQAADARKKPAPPTTIRVLVLYTPEALRRIGSHEQMEALVRGDVDLSNSAFANSRIPLHLELAAVRPVTYHDSGSIPTDLQWVRSDAVPLRREHDASIAVLIVDNVPGFCGYADILPSDTFLDQTASAQGQALVWTRCLGSLIFAHEVGHTLGCQHDPAHGYLPEAAIYPYAYGHYVDGVFRTVMSYPDDCELGCPAVPYFSSPGLRFAGFPTGIANRRDNARVIQATRVRFSGPMETDCRPGPATLCLQEGRFKVQVDWAESADTDALHLGRAVTRTDTTGFFGFRDPAAPDLLVRIVASGNSVTVSHGALGPFPYRLVVTDLPTGTSRAFFYSDGQCGGRVPNAFPAAGARAAARGGKPSCASGRDAVCLHGRFQVKVDGPEGAAGAAAVTRTTGAFDLGGDGDPELAVKIAPQGKKSFDVFYGALTDQAYTITITDTRTGAVKSYESPAGRYCGGSEGGAF